MKKTDQNQNVSMIKKIFRNFRVKKFRKNNQIFKIK